MYVISGATGHTGKVAATKLLAQGKPVRALVRSKAKAQDLAAQGAELVEVALDDRAGLEAALKGATGAYLLCPPDMVATDFIADRQKLFESVAASAKAAGVPHVVLLSSVGAHQPRGIGIIQTVRAAEQSLNSAGVTSTVLRAGYFVENWGSVLPVAKKDGVLPSFIPGDLAIPMVSSQDVGALAAQALLEGPRGARTLELGGPQDLTPRDVAAVVSKLLGRTIQLVEAPIEAVVPTFTSFGISENIASLYRDMYIGIRDGIVTWEAGKAEARRGATSPEATLGQLLK